MYYANRMPKITTKLYLLDYLMFIILYILFSNMSFQIITPDYFYNT
jgi:hypothetical protein